MKIIHIVLTAVSFLIAAICYSQSLQLEQIDSLLQVRETTKAFEFLHKIDTANLSHYQLAEYYLLVAKAEDLDNQTHKSFKYWLIARKKFRRLDSLEKVAIINLEIVQSINALQDSTLNFRPYMKEYLDYVETKKDPHSLATAYMQLGKIFINSEPGKTLQYFRDALKENQKTNDSLFNAKIHHNLGVVFGEYTPHQDSAFYHYDIALEQYKKQGMSDYISYIYNNKASVYKNLVRYDSAIYYYNLADSISAKEYAKENKRFLYANLSETYELKSDYKNAFRFLKLQNDYRDSIMQEEQNKAILDIQTKYEVKAKENENLKLKQNQTWLWIGIGTLFLVLLIGYLAYRNLQHKKKIADKENEIQQEKLESSLKEQELAGIDAMIEGQEKERQRIANELHDNLGSLLATLKLHFQNLKVRKDRVKEEEDLLLKKTDDLIDEAYQQVRRIAHAKNAGVKAQEGLLPAVKNFASNVSASKRLIIEVEEHGMHERLENSLEITIFRIIQELITNVIKHADAKEVVIHLTNHGDGINIMVEDDGKGFLLSEIQVKEGMGIHSIQRRVEYQGGTVDIESVPEKGTTVIINIPVI